MGVDDQGMAQQQGGDAEDASGDYSYDEAHDAVFEPHQRPAKTARHPALGPGGAPPPDEDGDYSYDLAHEVPRAKE